MEYKREDFINSTNIADMLERLENGERLAIGEWELFMSYTDAIWTRRKMTKEEMMDRGWVLYEPGWEQIPYKTLEEALDKIGCNVQKQVSIFDVMKE